MRYGVSQLMILAVLLVPGRGRAEELLCAGFLRTAAPVTSSDYRKYAPERSVDMLHLSIDVTPDFKNRSISARTVIRFTPLGDSVTRLTLNAEDLRVAELSSSAELLGWQNTGSEIEISFSHPLPRDEEQTVTIRYSAFPKKGIYFRTAEMGYSPEDEHLFTHGEDSDARYWIPCYDAPNDKLTSEITCHVPDKMTVISNGRFVSQKLESDGLKSVHWSQEKPHTTYLISLVAGNFKKIEDKHGDTPLAFYAPASQIELAPNSFKETKEIMDFFENEIGVPYPWDKYDQVCVQDFVAGGMENTSVTTLTDRTLHPDETETIRDSQGLVAHEMAHQWFGDLVTCKDWSQLWLNEGFATYYAHLYNLHKDGRDDFLYGLFNSSRAWINRSSVEDSRPIVFRQYDNASELFGFLVYPKAGWVLHMLRAKLGPEVYRKGIKAYLERYQFQNVTTHQFSEVMEEVSGRSLDRFFDQWIVHPHHPELKVSYAWDQTQKLARISVAQVQQLTNGVALFDFPLAVRFTGAFGRITNTVRINEQTAEFFMPLPGTPEIVRIDPDYELLAKITFEPPRKMLLAQLKDETDMIGRIFAMQLLSKSSDKKTIDAIADRLKNDPFYGVRIEAAEALRRIHTKEALVALIASAEQQEARVRQKIVIEVGQFFDPAAMDYAIQVAADEKNPDIQAQAIRSLAAYSDEKSRAVLYASLKGDSFQDEVSNAAIAAMRAQNEPSYIPPIVQVLEKRKTGSSSRSLAAGLDALAYLSRNEENKDPAYEFILDQTGSARESVRVAAIKALGTLQDERAIPVLTGLASGAKEAAETKPAATALELVRSQRPVVREVQGLRTELLDLKKQNDEMKKMIEELQKKVDAVVPAQSPRSSGKPEKRGSSRLRKLGAS